MQISNVPVGAARTAQRLDARHLMRLGTRTVNADDTSLGQLASSIRMPGRARRYLAAPLEPSLPYLRPYDIFDYLPAAADYVSVSRTPDLEQLRVAPGTILQTRSGRNLGPAVVADAHLANFVFSDDLIQIRIDDPEIRYAVLAYLRTSRGRSAITHDRSGSVIDHLQPAQVSTVPIPPFEPGLAAAVAVVLERATRLRESARASLGALVDQVAGRSPSVDDPVPLSHGFQVSVRTLHERLDAAYYNPIVRRVRSELQATSGIAVADVATPLKPGGRYSPRYVAPEHGQPLMSGRQILQWAPINLRHVAPGSIPHVDRYRLTAGMVLYQADGRAEEGLGTPVVVTTARDGWLASGHVGRLVPLEGIRSGRIFVGLATPQAQLQLRATASGSVVDSTFESDVARVILPHVTDEEGAAADAAWADLGDAGALEDEATAMVAESLDRATAA